MKREKFRKIKRTMRKTRIITQEIRHIMWNVVHIMWCYYLIVHVIPSLWA